jgi:hypothetical protein
MNKETIATWRVTLNLGSGLDMVLGSDQVNEPPLTGQGQVGVYATKCIPNLDVYGAPKMKN